MSKGSRLIYRAATREIPPEITSIAEARAWRRAEDERVIDELLEAFETWLEAHYGNDVVGDNTRQ